MTTESRQTHMRALWETYAGSFGAADAAYMALRELIQQGVLTGGEHLVEETIAGTFGVSRTPVREAIHRLEAEHLASRVPRRGVVVRELSRKEVEELFEVRIVLEELAASLMAKRATSREIAQLRAINEQLRIALKDGLNAETANEISASFHDLLYTASGNAVLIDLAEQVNRWPRRFCGVTFEFPGRSEEIIAEHEELILAIEERSPEQAAAIAGWHKRRTREVRLSMLNETRPTQDVDY